MSAKIDRLSESLASAEAAYKTLDDELVEALASRALTSEELEKRSAAEARVSQIREALTAAEADEARGKEFAEARAAKLGAEPHIEVKSEPITYAEGSGNSFYRDLFTAQTASPGTADAWERLRRHQHEIEVLADGPQSTKEARAARKLATEARRKAAESRAVSTSTSSAGDFAPPLYFLPDYSDYRTYGRAFIDALRPYPLPETGMTFNVPAVTTPDSAVNQTTSGENQAITAQDMVVTFRSGNLQTFASNAQVSQQMLDRAGPGVEFDQVILADQARQLNKVMDQYAWDQVWANVNAQNAYTLYTDSSFNLHKFNQSVQAAKAKLNVTDGTVTEATHVFTDANVWGTIAGAYDANNRLQIVPQGVAWNPAAVGNPTNVPEGYTGFELAGTSVFKDQNAWLRWNGNSDATPSYIGDHPTLVADLSIGAFWLEGSPVVRVLPQPYANQLTVLIQTYVYGAIVIRYPNAFQVVVGTGTASANLTA